MNLGSVETFMADLRADFRRKIIAAPLPAQTFTTVPKVVGRELTAPSEPGLDFVAAGFKAGDYAGFTGFRNAPSVRVALVKVETGKLTFAKALTGMVPAAGGRVAVGMDYAWEDESFDPVKGQPFVQEVVQGAGSRQLGIGRGGVQQHTVLLTATLFYPSGQGTLGIESMAGRLLKQFKPGVGLSYGPTSGLIMQAEIRKLLPEAEWTTCPMTARAIVQTTD